MAFEAQPDIGGKCGAGRRRLQRDRRRVPSQGGLAECLELSSSFKRFTIEVLVFEIASRLMTSKKRSAQRAFECVFVLSDCSLLQAIQKKKPNTVLCDADAITIYSKNQESCSLARSWPPIPFLSLLHRM